MISNSQAQAIIEQRLSPRLVKHCEAVAQIAKELALQYGINSDKAYLAGLLHDLAKGKPGGYLLALAQSKGLIICPMDSRMPELLHAPVGAWLIQNELEITEPDIIQAISNHTLGAPDMTDLDKIIYLADMIEPGRDYPGLERLQCLTYRDLDQAMVVGLETTLKYCIDQGRLIHPRTVETRNYLLDKIKSNQP